MTSYAELMDKMGTGIIDAAKPAQDLIAQTMEATDALVGKLPTMPALPGSDRMPTPREVVEANYRLAERLLAAQKEFALRLVSVTEETARVFIPAQASAREDLSSTASV